MVVEIELSKKGKHAGKYVTIVDDCDSDLAEFNWKINLHKDSSLAYAVDRGTKKIHRVIMERMLDGRKLLSSEFVDHIDRDGLNNCRNNLRLSTHGQNQHNAKKRRDNSSGYKGVRPIKGVKREGSKKWRAYIRYNRKDLYLGVFYTPEEAHEAYKAKAIELFGEFARFE